MGLNCQDVEESGAGPPLKRAKLNDSGDTGGEYTPMAQRMMVLYFNDFFLP